MLLCLFPFEKETFRYPRKVILIGYGVMSILFSAGFPIVKQLPVFNNVENLSGVSNAYMLFVAGVFTALYFWIIRTELIKKLMVLIFVLFYAATQYLLVNLVTPLFPGGSLPDTYPPLILALYAGTALMFFPFAVLLLRTGMKRYMEEMELKNIRREFTPVFVVTVFYFFILMFYTSSPELLSNIWWWIIPPLLLAVAVFSILYWILFKESIRRKNDDEQRRTLEIEMLQYEGIVRDIEQARRMNHDMRHYLNHLSELLNRGDLEGMESYMSSLIMQVSHRENVNYCKNATINGLLQYYVGLAKDKDIRCEVQAECGDLIIAPVDLTVLLGNGMENAIRACEKITGNRWIAVKIGVIGDSLVMQIANTCQEIYPSGKYRLDGTFLPAAAFVSNRKGGGYGLRSLEHTAKKYHGDARFCYEEQTKTFTTRIQLNIHPEIL